VARKSKVREPVWNVLDSLPDFGGQLLSASADVVYLAIGATAILSGSVAEAAADALAWVLPPSNGARRDAA
jgi:hypothetical protein